MDRPPPGGGTGHGVPTLAAEMENQTYLLPRNLKCQIKRQEPTVQPQLGQEVPLGSGKDEPGAGASGREKVEGAGGSPSAIPIEWSE